VNGRELTTPIRVEPDPDASVSTQDLDTRRTFITQIISLQSKTEPANTRADSLDTQIITLAHNTDGAPKPAKDSIDSAVKESEKIKTELARINRSVSQLFGQVAGSPFKPTATQREEFEDLQKDFDKESASLDTLLNKSVPAIEKQLNDAGVPRISVK
jgi:hypothetical protein